MFYFKKLKLCYFLIILSIALLITTQFIKEKEIYCQIKNTSVPRNQYISIEGKLTAYPEIKGDHSIIYLKTEYLEYHKKKVSRNLNLRIKVEGRLEKFYRGDVIRVDAVLYPANFSENFSPNPLENLQLVRKIHFYGYSKSSQLVSRMESSGFFWRFFGSWRNQIRRVLEENMNPQYGVLLRAILIGERVKISPCQEEKLLSVGVFHLLAISGGHIVIILLLCMGILKLFRVPYKTRYIVTAIVLIVFLILTGFKISAERAVLMAIVVSIARILSLEYNAYNIISFCGFVLLIRNPAEFLDAGFILTFSLTAAIVMGRNIFVPYLRRWFPKDSKLNSFLIELISANTTASIMALPLSLFFFKRYSFLGFLSGLLLIPLTMGIIMVGLLIISLVPISPLLTKYLVMFADIPIGIFYSIIDFFSKNFDFNLYHSAPPFALIVIVYLCFYFLSVSFKNKEPTQNSSHRKGLWGFIYKNYQSIHRRKWYKLALCSILLLINLIISLQIFYYNPDHMEVFFLDVGQGDAQVVVFPGGDALLIDGGGSYFSDFQVGKKILLPFILEKKIKIKWVAISHFHPDHVKGIIETLGILKPKELWISERPVKELGYQNLLQTMPPSVLVKKITALDSPIQNNSEHTMKIGDCKIEVLYPQQFLTSGFSHNNHSQVIKISDPHHSFLFTGDIELEVESILMKNKCQAIQATVIKVPHHGSVTSSSSEFLECVKPEWAVFSCSENNRFGFPHKKVLKSYRNQGAKLLSTAHCGGIQFISLPEGLQVVTSR